MNIPRIAAGMSMANSDGKRHSREYDPLKKESKVGAFLAVAIGMALILSPLWWSAMP